jgi:chaperonin GroES
MTSPNIAEDLDRADLQEIGNKVVEGFERDLDSRAEWEERNAEALKLALQVREGKSYPWPNAANVHYPLVTVACMQYNARAYPALEPNSKMVKHRVIGADPDGSKEARARRVSSHMNYQLTVEDESWEEGFDRLLMTEPLLGCSFEKSYFDGEKTVNEHVTPEYFVVDYYTKSLEECRRQTHIIPKHKNQIVERMRTGEWKEYDISDKYASYEQSEISNAMDEAQGVVEPYDTEDAPFTVIEQHCYLDLDNDGYDEPYIVTVLTDTREVLRIVPRFQPENILFNQRGQVAKITPDTYFTKFGFIPSPDGGFYDIGFGILLSPMNESVNTIINQLIDAGTLSNLQSGFISKNVRIADGRAQFTPGEWKKVNATGDDLRKGIMPLPVREPSQTLMALLGVLIEAGQKIGSVSEMMMGENPGQNQPAMTTMNVLEQGLKVYSSIIKRNHRSLKSMFRKMYKLNALYLNPEEYFEVIDEQAGQGQNEQPQGVVYQSDYFGISLQFLILISYLMHNVWLRLRLFLEERKPTPLCITYMRPNADISKLFRNPVLINSYYLKIKSNRQLMRRWSWRRRSLNIK